MSIKTKASKLLTSVQESINDYAEIIADTLLSLSYKERVLSIYVIGSLFILCAPSFLVPLSMHFIGLVTLSLVIFAINIVEQANGHHVGKVEANVKNAAADVVNKVGSFFSQKPVASKYAFNDNITYGVITLALAIVGINILPIRAATTLFFMVNTSYMVRLMDNLYTSAGRLLDIATITGRDVMSMPQASKEKALAEAFFFDNNPWTTFREYGCGTAQEVLTKGIRGLSA